MESSSLLDGTEDELTTKLIGKTMLGPENSCTNDSDLNPKNNKAKPNRRRSRASKKAPLIHLNANATNFRALVQQFTGCQSASSSSFKGPINLDFGGGSEENDLDITAEHQSIRTLGYNNFVNKIKDDDQEHDQQLQFEDLQKQVYEEDQERMFSYGNFDRDAASLSTSGNLANYPSTMENMAVENISNFFDGLPGDFFFK